MMPEAEGVTRLRVRYGETDQMGFVYHPNYLVWCEIGRTELMRALGYAYADIERAGIRLAVAEASLRYMRAALYDDEIRIVTSIETAQSRAITFRYEILRERDESTELLASARTKLIAIDERGSPCRLPHELLRTFRDSTID
ncbi:MAG TPA: thioesterase family protein [Longimicrobiales bacterium]